MQVTHHQMKFSCVYLTLSVFNFSNLEKEWSINSKDRDICFSLILLFFSLQFWPFSGEGIHQETRSERTWLLADDGHTQTGWFVTEIKLVHLGLLLCAAKMTEVAEKWAVCYFFSEEMPCHSMLPNSVQYSSYWD